MNSLRVLFVTERFDAPYRYRCLHACEQLRSEGAIANVLGVDSADLPGAVRSYGVVVLFRLPWSDRVGRILEAARSAHIAVLFDIDDVTFDERLEELVPFRKRLTAAEWKAAYGDPMVRLRRTLDACSAFIGSTAQLAERATRLGKPAFVHPNVVHPHYLTLGRLLSPFRPSPASRPLIGYFSGSNTHDEDFASIAGPVTHVLRRHPSARLLVVGHLDAALRGGIPKDRLVRLPYMHWRDFALAYAACQVTLAPLALDNDFTGSKSALKYFEAGAFGTPVIASPVREMARAIRDGETGFLASSEREWTDALERALCGDVAARVGGAARRDVEAHHSFGSVQGKLSSILGRFHSESRGEPPRATRLESLDERGPSARITRLLRPLFAAKDTVKVLRAVRGSPRGNLSPEELERLQRAVDTALGPRTGGAATPPGGGVLAFSAADVLQFRRNREIDGVGDLPGELRAAGADPSLEGPPLDASFGPFRFVAVRLRGTTDAPVAHAQLYVKGARASAYEERKSLTIPYPADGSTTTQIVDLLGSPSVRAWRRLRRGSRLRVDPTDRPGSFRIEGVVFLPESAMSVLPASPPGTKAARRVVVPSSEGDLQPFLRQLVQELPPRAPLHVEFQSSVETVRRALRGSLDGVEAIVASIVAGSDGQVVVELFREGTVTPRGLDVVIPVWNRLDLVLRCVASVLRHAEEDCRVVVVDDASTEPEMGPALAELERNEPRVIVLRNPENQGFLGTANRGMAHAAGSGRDVLLLNSDTEVFEGFSSGLRRAAYSAPDVGLVSPLSNNATICSVPDFCTSNSLPPGVSSTDVANMVRKSSRRRYPDLPTPHGFCLYVRSDCLLRTGTFDRALFGRGFGEENDLGERARIAGFRTVLADDVYVWHEGKASFGEEGHALERLHAEVLERRHPGYHRKIARFVEQNPLLPVQTTVRRHLSRRSHDTRAAPLFVLHSSPYASVPGGVEHHVLDLVRALRHARAVLVYRTGATLEVAEILNGEVDSPLFYALPLRSAPERFCHDDTGALDALDEILTVFRVGWVHVHHLMFLPLTLGTLLRRRGIPYLVTVHDFYLACPSYNLLNLETLAPCCPEACRSEDRVRACQAALFQKLGEHPPADLLTFRREHLSLAQALLDGARTVVFPSRSTRDLVARMLRVDTEKLRVIPHEDPVPGSRAQEGQPSRAKPSEGPLRVALVGQVAYPTKGAEAYLSVVARTAHSPIEWHVFGKAELFGFEKRLRSLRPPGGVVLHGPYDRRDIVEKLRAARIDVGLLLPAWPETFSYTLSELLAARVPVVARRIGALVERLTGLSSAFLVDGPEEASGLLERMANDRRLLPPLTERGPVDGARAWADTYRELHEQCASESIELPPTSSVESDYHRLEEIAQSSPVLRSSSSVVRPDPALTSAHWFGHLERFKAIAPETLRRFARARLARDATRPVRAFRIPGRDATLEQELTVDRRYLGTTRLVSHGTDPRIRLHVEPFDPRRVSLLRFDLWCSTPHAASAQLYWRHAEDEPFTEAKSVIVPLEGKAGDWLEYSTRLDVGVTAAAWTEGERIVGLRFDPIDLPGPFIVGMLTLRSSG